MRALAEDPAANTAEPPGFRRFLTGRYCLFLGPWPSFTSVQRLRCADDEVEPTVAEIRGLIAVHGHRQATWWVGESARPRDLVRRLLDLGFERGKPGREEPRVTAMAAVRPLPPGPEDVQARPVETLAEFALAREIQWEAFGIPERERAEQRAVLETMWADRDAPGTAMTFLALVDGEPAATALAVYADHGALLIGGGTLAEARGRGAYRALIRARWDEAVRRGTPALVVQAGTMSRPILDRVGFQPVCEIEILVDPVR